MKLTNPFHISARLLPALSIGGATIQLERLAIRSDDNRQVFRWTIDLPNGKASKGSDLRGGCGGRETFQEMFCTLLGFLDASAEGGENEDLFPRQVVRWAKQNSDEIGMMRCGIEESKTALIEE